MIIFYTYYFSFSDPEIEEALKPWVEEANLIGNTPLGTTLVLLDNKGCYSGECNIGNFFTDAMVIEVILYKYDTMK